jgi:hypothetical protein
MAVIFIPSALAVHDLAFELDGNAVATSQSDWSTFFNGSGPGGAIGPRDATGKVVPIAGSLTSPFGFTAGSAVQDFATKVKNGSTVFDTSDPSTYTVGSKDIDNVSSWVCTPANNVTNKGDILNTYAVAYTDPNIDPVTLKHDQILYFGLERSTNTGDANVAFWFLQDGTASCPAGGGNFTGNHKDGDILVVSAFTKGGTVSTINAYRWNGGATGSLGTTPVASGGDCNSNPPPNNGDTSCATANKAPVSNWPWLTYNSANGLGNTVDTAEFFEGGLNLTKSNLGGKCFNAFLSDTRSSQQLNATLYDFGEGTLGECKTNLSTTAGDTAAGHTPENNVTPVASPTSIGGGSAGAGTDTAALQVTGIDTWGGTLSFYLCGPGASAPASGPACDRNKGVSAGTVNVSETDQNTHYFASPTALTLTSAGSYCWTAHFEPDSDTLAAGVSAADDSGGSGECFTVAKVTPTLTTCSGSYTGQGTPPDCVAASPVAFGSAIHDSARLSGLAKEPGSNGGRTSSPAGTVNPCTVAAPCFPTINATGQLYAGSIAFTLKGPNPSACGITTNNSTTQGDTNPQSVAVDTALGNKVYGPVSYTPGAPGVYHWQATIDNVSPYVSPNNTLPQSENNANCTDTNEDVTVQQIPTSISTVQKVYPQDSATITSSAVGDNIPAGGTVTLSLYGNDADNATNLANCQAGLATGRIYTTSFSTFNGDGSPGNPAPAHSETFSTNQTSVAVNTNQTVYWLVTYGTGDLAHTGRQSKCLESTQTAFVNDSSGGTLFP